MAPALAGIALTPGFDTGYHQEGWSIDPDVAKYRVTYRMDVPGDDGKILFVVIKDISRYTQQDPFEWYNQSKAEWAGKKIVSIEMFE